MSSGHSHEEVIEIENKRFNTFINIALILVVLTGIELVVIFPPFPDWFVYTVLITLSIAKFLFVIFWFMHLIYDKQLLFWLFASGMILATGTIAALLLLLSRADVDTEAWSMSGPVLEERVDLHVLL